MSEHESSTLDLPKKEKKSLILNAFVEMCSGHQSPGLWQHPDDRSYEFNDVHHWIELAKLLEEAKFHGIFIADVLGTRTPNTLPAREFHVVAPSLIAKGGYDVYRGPQNLTPAIVSGAQWPVNEPLAVVSAMASATNSIGFGVTVATTYEQPYHLARRLSTIDHLSKGRLGWNIVTGYLDSAARNLGLTEQPQHDNRYDVAEEYISIMYKLFESSWRDDAVVLNRQEGIYTHPDRVRLINHQGKHFRVPGPHICQPSPQRTPLLLQAGTSRAGKTFAAQHAEAVFVAGHSPSVIAKNIAEVRELAQAQFGRRPENIKFLAMMCPVLGRTEEEAARKFEEYRQYGQSEGAFALFGGWTGIDMSKYGDDEELRHVESNAIRSAVEAWSHSSPSVQKWTKHTVAAHLTLGGLGGTVVGTPAQIADELERWVAEADVDGFNFSYALFPSSFHDIINLLLPELRQRGIFWSDYAVPDGTYRENFYRRKGQTGPLEEHVASTYRWRAGVEKEDHVIPS